MRRLVAAALVLGALVTASPGGAAPQWGWLGVRIRDLSEQEMEDISRKFGLREGFGAVVVEVLKDTPAEAGGIKTGDVVVAVRDRPVVDTRTLQRAISATGVGDTVALTVLRRDQGRRPVSVKVGAMPEAVVAERVAAEYGFFLGDVEGQPELGGARPPALPPSVAAVVPKSRAEAAGLKAGDVFLEVNGRAVGTLIALREALVGVAPDGPLSLVVRRDRERLTVLLDRAKTP
jgi:serine protease Do